MGSLTVNLLIESEYRGCNQSVLIDGLFWIIQHVHQILNADVMVLDGGILVEFGQWNSIKLQRLIRIPTLPTARQVSSRRCQDCVKQNWTKHCPLGHHNTK